MHFLNKRLFSSGFDPSAFLDATTTEASVKRTPLPAGRDFTAVIGEPKIRQSQGKKDPTQTYTFIDLPIEIDLTAYPDVQATMGSITKVTIIDGISLTINPQTGGIDNSPGANGKLRRYREALDLNKAGEPFAIRSMQGRLLKVKIKHEPYEGEIYDKIDSVAHA